MATHNKQVLDHISQKCLLTSSSYDEAKLDQNWCQYVFRGQRELSANSLWQNQNTTKSSKSEKCELKITSQHGHKIVMGMTARGLPPYVVTTGGAEIPRSELILRRKVTSDL